MFHTQQIIERICCVTFYPSVGGNYSINCYVDSKNCLNSPFVLKVEKNQTIYKYPPSFGSSPIVSVPYEFDFSLWLPQCISGNIRQPITLTDKSFIQATLINTLDCSSQWLRIHPNMTVFI